VGDDMVIVIGL